jgi:hypothetical protein
LCLDSLYRYCATRETRFQNKNCPKNKPRVIVSTWETVVIIKHYPPIASTAHFEPSNYLHLCFDRLYHYCTTRETRFQNKNHSKNKSRTIVSTWETVVIIKYTKHYPPIAPTAHFEPSNYLHLCLNRLNIYT